MNLNVFDIIILVIYFIALLGTGIYALFASRRGTVSGYFLAGRFMTWLPVGASLFASNIGSEHFIGLAGSGAAAGIAVGAFELNASILLQLLGWVFLPVYIASGVFTLPEYMKKRFGGERIHIYLAVLSLILYIFTKISVNLYSGSLFLTEALNWNTWVSIVLLLLLTGLITVTGGLAAVLYTDTLQFFVMIIGALVLSIISYIKVNGFNGVLSLYGQAIAKFNTSSNETANALISLANAVNTTGINSLAELADLPEVSPTLKCSLPSTKAFTLLRGINDPDMPWLGFLLGQTPASIWYWCADQMMVQRVLAAKSLSHAQGATLMAGLIKQLPLFIMVIPGMISRILFPDEIACIPGPDCYRICGQKSGCSNLAYPKLVISVMPSGLRGLMLAVMLAALISDLTSIFNSASTLFTVDIYQKIRKKAKNMELMIVSRIFVIVLILLSIAWIPVIQELQGSQLFPYIQAVSAYLAPPVAAVYLCAILNKRSTERGAFIGLMYGLLIGIIRLILTIIYHEPICGELDTRPWIIKNVHYMYFALFSFFTCGLIVCLVSLTEKSSTNEQLYRLTYWTAWDNRNNNNSNNNDIDDNNLYNSKIQNGIHSNEIIIMIKTDHSDGQEVDYKDDDEDEAEKEHNDDVQEKKGKKKRKHKKKKQKKETSSGDSDVNNHNNKKGYKHPQQEQQQQQQEKGEIISRPKTKFDKLKPLYNAEKNTSLQFDSDINVEQKQPVNKTSTEGPHPIEDETSLSKSSSSSPFYRLIKNICLWFCGCADHPCSDPEVRDRYGCKCCPVSTHDNEAGNSRRHPISGDIIQISSSDTDADTDDDDLKAEMRRLDQEKHLAKITSLKQDPQVKFGLYIGLVIIMILSVFGFIFFSVYFGPIEIGPIPVMNVDDQSSLSSGPLNDAIELLKKNGLIKTQ